MREVSPNLKSHQRLTFSVDADSWQYSENRLELSFAEQRYFVAGTR